jgi:hypothetical protein
MTVTIILPQTPGIVLAVSGTETHRSGLDVRHKINRVPEKDNTNLNSDASSPQIALSRLKTNIGMNSVCPFVTLKILRLTGDLNSAE